MLTQEEWGQLTPEEQAERAGEKPQEGTPPPAAEVKEDVVIIDGKPRPLKNFMSEFSRKVKEQIMSELPAMSTPATSTPPTSTPPGNTDYTKEVLAAMDREMQENGGAMPVRTIINLIGSGSQYNVNKYAEASRVAKKTLKEVKKELKAQYKDFGSYEEEFDEILEDVHPSQITKDGVKLLFNSLRGKNVDDIVKVRVEEAMKEKRIIGETTVTTTAPASTRSVALTEGQKKEMKDMGFETEEDYLGRLNKKREIAKARKAKNIPETMSELLVY